MRRLHRELVVLVIASAAALSGCTALNDRSSADSASSLSRTSNTPPRGVALASYNEPVEQQKTRGPLKASDFYPSNLGTTVKQLSGNGPNRDKARKLYDEGESQYREAVAARSQQGDTDEGGADVRDLFREASDKYLAAAGLWPDSAMEEDALFRAAESQFYADAYVKSNDYFEKLLKKYPNSRYLDLVGARRFVIAQYWIKLDEENGSALLGLNLTDKQRPWSDAFGHAIRIYDRMRLDDPTGKLADDATIAAANALFAHGDYDRADQYYTDLRTNFPSSEHQFMAHYLGIQAKLRGYRGPEFAGAALDEAEKLVKQVRRQFPAETRQRQEELEKAYREVRYRKAEREWAMAEFYQQRREYGAARFYYDLILADFSDTPFADKARAVVPDISGIFLTPPQRLSWLVDLFPDGRSPEPIMATAPDDTNRR